MRTSASPAQPGGNHNICTTAFFPVWHLSRKNALEFFHRHAGPSQRAARLQGSRRGNHPNRVTATFPTPFEQQRNVEQYLGPSLSLPQREETAVLVVNQRMQNRL